MDDGERDHARQIVRDTVERSGYEVFRLAVGPGRQVRLVLDRDPGKIGAPWGKVVVRDVRDLERTLAEDEIDVVILAVPEEAAQLLTDLAVGAGVRGILNFAPVQLRVPPDVAVQDVNVVTELEALSFELTRSRGNGAG